MKETVKMVHPDKSDQGRLNQQEGAYFEERVAELYRLLRYAVEHGRLFSGRQVDLFLIGKFGDLIVHRAIECKLGPVKSEHIDSFVAKLRLVRKEYPAAQGTIVSGVSFSDAVYSQASQEGIQLTLYRDLAAQLFDSHSYVKSLIAECETNERYKIPMYIEPYVGYEESDERNKAFAMIDDWLRDSSWNQLTLLGDVGTGKSFLSRMVAYRLAKRFVESPLDTPTPILIDLRNADRQFSLEGLVLTHLAKSGLSHVSFDVFQYSLAQGYIVLILDGFDEMSVRVTKQVTTRNFHELSRSVQGRSKVLLTCRTHYFKSRTEEEEIILGGREDYGSETARDLYWELIARKGFRIAYLRPFEISQVEEYIARIRPTETKEALSKIRSTYNLAELSQRPMLLEMIVKSLDTLSSGQINAATLYKVFTDAWIHRDSWRDVLSPEAKLGFVTALARSLWEDDVPSIHYTRLLEYLRKELSTQIEDAQHLMEVDSEIRTASFLTRDELGHYGLAHKSYSEFFLARFLSSSLASGSADCLATRRLSPEVISFLGSMVSHAQVEPPLEQVLSYKYKPLISENALLCLYGFRRAAIIGTQESLQRGRLVVPLPEGIELEGAILFQVTLEGAVIKRANLKDANLSDAILSGANMTGANLTGARMERADVAAGILESARLDRVILLGANLDSADLTSASLKSADFTDASMRKVKHDGVDLTGAIFKGTLLPDSFKEILEPRTRTAATNFRVEEEVEQRYWSMVKHLMPYMLKVARWSVGVDDPEDLVSSVVLRVANSKDADRIARLSGDAQRQFFGSLIERSARRDANSQSFPEEYSDLGDSEESYYNLGDDHEYKYFSEDAGDYDQLVKLHRNLGDGAAADILADLVDLEVDTETDLEVGTKEGEGEVNDAQVSAQVSGHVRPRPLVDNLDAFGYGNPEVWRRMFMSDVKKVLSRKAARIVYAHYVYDLDLEEIARLEKDTARNIKRILGKSMEILRRRLAPVA